MQGNGLELPRNPSKPWLETIDQLHNELLESVRKRATTIPNPLIKGNARLGVLFSGSCLYLF